MLSLDYRKMEAMVQVKTAESWLNYPEQSTKPKQRILRWRLQNEQ